MVGVKLEFVDMPSFQVQSCLVTENVHRALIRFPRLQLLAMYQMFFQLKSGEIICLGRNEELVRWSLFYTAICCILQHELAHIYRGHLQLRELWQQEWEQHRFDWRTLEWDADRFVVKLLEENYAVWKENWGKETKNLEISALCGTLHGMMFWQRRQKDLCVETEKGKQLLVRECFILQRMQVVCERQQELFCYIKEYEKEFCRIFKNNRTAVMTGSEQEDRQAFLELQTHWQQIKKELQPYAIMTLEE